MLRRDLLRAAAVEEMLQLLDLELEEQTLRLKDAPLSLKSAPLGLKGIPLGLDLAESRLEFLVSLEQVAQHGGQNGGIGSGIQRMKTASEQFAGYE